jgi:hypothetical protein
MLPETISSQKESQDHHVPAHSMAKLRYMSKSRIGRQGCALHLQGNACQVTWWNAQMHNLNSTPRGAKQKRVKQQIVQEGIRDELGSRLTWGQEAHVLSTTTLQLMLVSQNCAPCHHHCHHLLPRWTWPLHILRHLTSRKDLTWICCEPTLRPDSVHSVHCLLLPPHHHHHREDWNLRERILSGHRSEVQRSKAASSLETHSVSLCPKGSGAAG